MIMSSTLLRRSAAVYCAVAWLTLLAGVWLAVGAGLSERAWLQAVAVFAAVQILLWRYLPRHRPQRRFGVANGVTLARAVATAWLAGVVGSQTADWAWLAFWVALGALLLDGVDGYLARRYGCASEFGARFDMETDALLILVLALLVWQADKAGVWIVFSGALRYGFIAAGRVWPALAAPLASSRRRQTVCVLQVLALLVCLCPWLEPVYSAPLALASLLMLSASFAVDVSRLLGGPGRSSADHS